MDENKDLDKKGRFGYLRSKYQPKREEAGEDLQNAGLSPDSLDFKRARAKIARKYVDKEQEGEIDQLTGVLNRKGTERRLNEQAAISKRNGTPFLILFFDVNGLKDLNDSPLGHEAGDQLIKSTARVLTSQERPGDIVGRWGGDEFVVVLPSASLEDALPYWDRKNTEFSAFRDEKYGIDSIWISVGVARGNADNLDRSLSLADKAMYQAKRLSKELSSNGNKVNLIQTEEDLLDEEKII